MRSKKGNTLLELPVALWITLFVFFIPMMAMATITLRCTLLNVAVLESVHAAAKARTFEQGSAEGQSAIQLSEAAFDRFIQAFPGLGAGKVSLSILATDVNNGAITRSASKLTQPSNSSAYIYQIEGTCVGSIEPVFGMSKDIFGAIPGLSAPMNISFSAKEMFENPQGLDR